MAKVILLPSAAKNVVSEILKIADLQEGDFLWLVSSSKDPVEMNKIREALTPLLKPGTNAIVASFLPEISVLSKEELLELRGKLDELDVL